jgi:hypothetical protein
MNLAEEKKKQTITQKEQKPSQESSEKESYYDGLQDQQDEFDRKTQEDESSKISSR